MKQIYRKPVLLLAIATIAAGIFLVWPSQRLVTPTCKHGPTELVDCNLVNMAPEQSTHLLGGWRFIRALIYDEPIYQFSVFRTSYFDNNSDSSEVFWQAVPIIVIGSSLVLIGMYYFVHQKRLTKK